MRRLCVQLTSGLLLTWLIVGCSRDVEQQEPSTSVSARETPPGSSPQKTDQRMKTASAF